MQINTSLFWSLALSLLLTGFITGWVIKSNNIPQPNNQVIRIHDTLKSTTIAYKTIPGQSFNVDSLTFAINTLWKDSLKTLYGKGLFEAKFNKEDKLGKREFTLESRIPIDPEANLVIDEQFALPSIYPKRTFGIYAGLGITTVNNITGTLGIKYYILDYKNFSLTSSVGALFPLRKGGKSLSRQVGRGCYLNLTSELKF
jgi:hypothetical protein